MRVLRSQISPVLFALIYDLKMHVPPLERGIMRSVRVVAAAEEAKFSL